MPANRSPWRSSEADDRYESEEQRAQAFVAAGHGCRATYVNVAERLPPTIEVPPLVLKTAEPPPTTTETEATPDVTKSFEVLDVLRRRHGELGNG